jgi:hypothetical protein
MSKESGWDGIKIGRGSGGRVLGNSASLCHAVHHKQHMKWPGTKLGPPKWEAYEYLREVWHGQVSLKWRNSTAGLKLRRSFVGFLPRQPEFEPKSCEICGRLICTEADFLRILRFSLLIIPQPSSAILTWYNRRNSGRPAKWTQTRSTLRT